MSAWPRFRPRCRSAYGVDARRLSLHRTPNRGPTDRPRDHGGHPADHLAVLALSRTIRLMEKIDAVIDEHGGWPAAFLTSKDGATASYAGS